MTEKNKQIIKKDLEQIEKAKILGIMKQYYHVSLDNFIAKTPSQIKAKQAIGELVSKLGKQILAISGPCGVGKTHLLCAGLLMADEGRYVTMMEVEIRIRSSHSPRGKETEAKILNELIKEPLLAIDDVNYNGKGTRLEHDWFTYLVSERQARLRPTILATNSGLCLEDLLGNFIISRVTETIIIDGPDHRQVNLDIKGDI